MASVVDFLVERLENAGVKYVKGVPGDYIFPLFERLCKSKKIELINMVDEGAAGFAADAAGRIAGIGCVAVTYRVGALKLCNAIAGAYTERSPVVVISGAPSISERGDVPLHHFAGNYEYQRKVFEGITCAQAVLDNSATAGYEIDRVFEALKHYKQPVYIELPRDIAIKPIQYDVYTIGTPQSPKTDPQNLEDALKEVSQWIKDSERPVILAGVELARFQIGKELIKFAERHNIPVACTLLSKSVIDEQHPLFIGVYAGNSSSQSHVRDIVEGSDCLLVCGEVITEATVGYRPSKAFVKRQMITSTVELLKVRNHTYSKVSFVDFCRELFKMDLGQKAMPKLPEARSIPSFSPTNAKLTTARLFEKINSVLSHEFVVIAEAGDSLLGGSDLITAQSTDCFLGQAVHLSMGFAIPAALGARLARPKLRPFVIIGDGAFQMSCSEISTLLRYNTNPIIVVLNNLGYTTERFMSDGKFNDVLNWNYQDITVLMGKGKGFVAKTESELNIALNMAISCKSDLCVVNCVVDPKDGSPALRRLGEAFSKRNKF